MKNIFLVPDSEISPHPVHRAWASTFCCKEIRTPFAKGLKMITKIFDEIDIPEDTDVLFCESSYCLPFAKRFKDTHKKVKIVLLVADRTYWRGNTNLFKWLYVRYYTKYVDRFIAVSEIIKKQIKHFSKKKVEVIRPFAVMGKESENKVHEIQMREQGIKKTGYEIT